MNEKIMVRKDICDISLYDLEGDLAEAIQFLKALEEDTTRHVNLKLEISYARYHDDSEKLKLTGERLETDREFKDRMALEARKEEMNKKYAEDKETKDLKEYQRLKKKFTKAGLA